MNDNRSKLKLILVFVLLLPLFTSCVTTPTPIEYSIENPSVIETEDVIIRFTLIPEEKSLELFGESGNVFGPYPGLLMKKQSYIIKMEIEAKRSPLTLDLRNIYLKVGDISSQSRNKAQLLNDWKTFLRNTKDREHAEFLTDKYMFSNKFTVTKDQPASGLIAFLKKYPESDDISITIGITPEGMPLQELSINL
ncbi:hypothetical protein [Spirochaeta isovalerica]|uniref:Lipoprotein n=1 Tax=Spirochaeta isovalerica TaxID=150 RepID=A0A841RAV4_9SPIO|nr:hypothetical protein [Spirochaeta isovalerica]MBB6481075.1 hypothetical protein [Spirochaeta isovalerica]